MFPEADLADGTPYGNETGGESAFARTQWVYSSRACAACNPLHEHHRGAAVRRGGRCQFWRCTNGRSRNSFCTNARGAAQFWKTSKGCHKNNGFGRPSEGSGNGQRRDCSSEEMEATSGRRPCVRVCG